MPSAKGYLDELVIQGSLKLIVELQKQVGGNTLGSAANPASQIYMRTGASGVAQAVRLNADGSLSGSKVLRTYYRSRG